MLKDRLLFIIYKVLSYSPILRITNDSRFGEIKNYSKKQFRISLISFNVGKRILHLISFCFKNREMNFFKIINLEKVCDYPNKEKASKSYESYEKEIEKLDEDKVLNHKEALLYKINRKPEIKNNDLSGTHDKWPAS